MIVVGMDKEPADQRLCTLFPDPEKSALQVQQNSNSNTDCANPSQVSSEDWLRSTFLKVPHIKTCSFVYQCKEGTENLSPNEIKTLNEIISIVKPGTSKAEITKNYSLASYEDSIKLDSQFLGFPAGAYVRKFIWYVPFPEPGSENLEGPRKSHIEVILVNNEAVKFSWWVNGGNRNVNVYLTKNESPSL